MFISVIPEKNSENYKSNKSRHIKKQFLTKNIKKIFITNKMNKKKYIFTVKWQYRNVTTIKKMLNWFIGSLSSDQKSTTQACYMQKYITLNATNHAAYL